MPSPGLLARCCFALLALACAIAPPALAAAPAPLAPASGASTDEPAPDLLSQALQSKFRLRTWTLQQPSFPADVATRTAPWKMDVNLGREVVTLELERSSVRAPDAELRVAGPGGFIASRPLPAEQVFSGRVQGVPGSRVALCFVRSKARAVIDLADGHLHFLQAVAEADESLPPDAYVAYAEDDVVATQHACGGGLPAWGDPHQLEGDPTPPGPSCNRLAQIAFDADFAFYQQNGSDVAATVADIESVLAGMNLIYARDTNVNFVITSTIVRTDGTLYASSSINTLLDSLVSEWNTHQTSVVRDTTHLMTGQPTGGVIGLAYVTVVCTNLAYGVSQSRFTTDLAGRIGVTAHEVGHNFSAGHCDGDPDCFIMCSGIGGCSGSVTHFGSRDVAAIRSHAASRTCLTLTGPFATEIPPGIIPDRVTIATQSTVSVDVLANDSDGNCQAVTIQSFDSVSRNGGTITRLVQGGQGGRDVLRYTPYPNAAGGDQFNYVGADSAGNTGSATAFITNNRARNPDAAGPTLPGLDVAFYRMPGNRYLPDFATLTPLSTQRLTTVNIPSTTGNFAGSGRADNVAATFTGTLTIPADGTYTFFTESDDGSQLFIDGRLVVDNDGLHSMFEASGAVALTAGPKAFRIEFFEGGGGAGCIARWQGPGIAKQIIPPARFASGVTATYYALPGALSTLPDFAGRTAYKRSTVADVNLPSFDGLILDSGRADDVASVFTGYLSISTQAAYTFYVESDDASKLFIGNSLVVLNDGPHGMVERSGQITLRTGLHAIRMEWVDFGSPCGMIARYESGAAGIAKSVIPASAYSRPNPCTPDFNNDGVLNPDDLSDFIGAYFSTPPGPGSDVNRDGVVDPDDLSDFIASFFGGCP
ncbi:MAG: PA14 domain-containing protein [Polaromonas sp.]